jgi:DNA repair exonuclease SbcCD ATPase subunit
MSSFDGQAIEQLTIAIKEAIQRDLQETIQVVIERQFASQLALIAPVHERNIQAVETFGQTVANLVEQEGQLQAEVTRLDKAIDTTHAANQAVREQDKQELLEKQANVERAQNELQKTMAQHDEWIHKRYTDSIETGATKLINAFDESRVKPLDDEVRALRAAVDGRPQQADITKLIGEQMLAKTKEHVHLQQQSSKLLLEMEKLRGNEEKLQKKSEETAKQVMQLELELDKLRGNEVAQQSQEKHEALLQEIEKLCGNEELRIEAVEKIQEALGKPYEQEKLRDNETHELRKSLKELKENYERLRADVCSTNADEGGGSCADVCTENYERLRADVCSTNAGAGGGSCADVCSTENYGQLRADVCSTNDDEVGGSCADHRMGAALILQAR